MIDRLAEAPSLAWSGCGGCCRRRGGGAVAWQGGGGLRGRSAAGRCDRRGLGGELEGGGRRVDPLDEGGELRGEHLGVVVDDRLAEPGEGPGGVARGQARGVDRVLEPGAAGEALGEQERPLDLGQSVVDLGELRPGRRRRA